MSFNPLSNLPLKIGALLLAFLLWVHVATNKTYEHIFEIPIHVVNIPDGLILTSNTPTQLSAQIRGTGKQLLGLLTDDMIYNLDLGDFDAGNHSIEMTSAEVMDILSGGYEDVELLMPKRFQVSLEKKVTRELPVIANVDVTTGEGYVVMGELGLSPKVAAVTGPESVMRRLHHVETEPQSIVGVVESFDAVLTLQLPDSLRLSVPDSSVKVSIKVEARDERKFENISVDPPRQFNKKRYLFEPGTLSLELGVPHSLVDSVAAGDIEVSFEAPKSPEDSSRVPILYRLPARVELIKSSADSVLIIRKS